MYPRDFFYLSIASINFSYICQTKATIRQIEYMKKLLIIYGLFFLLYQTTLHAQNTLLDSLSSFVEDFKQEAQKENAQLWGVTFDRPLLLKTPDFVLSSISVEGFTPYKTIYYGTATDIERGGSTCMSWRGQDWSFYTYDKLQFADRKTRLNLFFHEVYHCNQRVLHLQGSWAQCKHLNEYNAGCLLRLEFTALLQALQSKNIDSIAIIDALTFRAYRYALYPNAYNEEAQTEMQEGLANYTGLKLSTKTTSEMISDIKTNMNCNPQLFAYWSGAAYCFVLDRVDSLWRKKITKNDNFLYFVQGCMKVQLPDNLHQHIEKIRNDYAWHAIETNEKAIAKETKQKEKRYTKLFFQKAVVHIPLTICRGFTFNSNIIFPLANGKVYNGFSTSGIWGHLLSKDEMFFGNEILLTEPTQITDTMVKGRNWEIKLEPHWTVKLQSKDRFELLEMK
jgi:hypothetical protein